jgi:membrane-associated phospholipid phosphatase
LQYVFDFVETKLMGRSDSAERTADETLFSQFWNSSTVAYFWNTVGERLSQQHHFSLEKNARFFAYLNIAMADSAIACWDAKYHYSFWRPITAIRLADTDGNDDTVVSPLWLPLLTTPMHPDYPSGHSTVSGGATTVLASYFGANTSFWVDSDLMPGVVRNFNSFDEARDEIANARIFAGIHFRTACVDGFATGTSAGNYVLQNALQPVHGGGHDHDDD